MRWILVLAVLLAACQSGAAIGTACVRSSECASPLVCRLGRCRVECRENRDCPAGSQCLLDQDHLGSCSIDTDRGCASGVAPCPSPLTCSDDRCVNSCATVAECPSDGECRASICFAPGRDDAGTVIDAGPPSDSGVLSCNGPACDGALAVGASFACAVRDGFVWCWGDNRSGQLGDGTMPSARRFHRQCGPYSEDSGVIVDAGAGEEDCSPTAVQVVGEDGSPLAALAVACSEDTACAITQSGGIACWGGDAPDDLGDVFLARPGRAHVVTGFGSSYVQIVAGQDYFCATRGTGGIDSVTCWGSDTRGQFGTGPDDVDAGHGITHADAWARGTLAAGHHLTCMIDGVGAVQCAGQNDNAGVGPMGDFPTDAYVPVQVFATGVRATRVVAGDGFACALMAADQSVQCWGWGASGSLGRSGTSVTDECVGSGTAPAPCDTHPGPLDGTAGLTFDGLWSGGDTSNACARDTTGQMWCWGWLGPDQCPFGGHCFQPARATPLNGALSVAMGVDSLCGLFEGGRVACIGYDDFGQLGDDAPTPRPVLRETLADVCFGGGC